VVFSLWSMPRLYKESSDRELVCCSGELSCCNGLVMRQLLTCKDMRIEAEDIVEICYQPMTGEGIAH
jgi:hypothetical protein